MGAYIDALIETDPETIFQNMVADMQAEFPGWQPARADLLTRMFRTFAGAGAETRDVSAVVPKAIFRQYGNDLQNLPPIDATSAIAVTTWTMTGSVGIRTIPAGTTFSLPGADGQPVAFNTVSPVTIPNGNTVTTAGQVVGQAVQSGNIAQGLTGTPSLVTTLSFVDHIALVGTTTGGVDAESDDTFLGRLRDDIALSAPRPILIGDAAVFARGIAGVARSLPIDNYNADTNTDGVARCVTTVNLDAAGAAVSSGTKTAVVADLMARREDGFLFFAIDPTYTTVGATFTIVAQTNYDHTDLKTRAEAALAAYLDPATWGLPTTGDQPLWVNTPVVRYLAVARILGDVDGVAYVTALSLNGGGAGVDVALAGRGPLPTAGTITGTVT